MPGCGCVATNSTPVVVKEDALGVKPDVVEQCTSFR